MEADWAFEIGGDSPVIEALWPGFVDLRAKPDNVAGLAECAELPGLADVLVKLNSGASPVWTCKSDVFAPDQIDPDELDAPSEEAVNSIACYIDVLMRDEQVWKFPMDAERTCRQLCDCLRAVDLRRCRVDIVVRKALVAETDQLGATVYFIACGRAENQAKQRLSECLLSFTDILLQTHPCPDGPQP